MTDEVSITKAPRQKKLINRDHGSIEAFKTIREGSNRAKVLRAASTNDKTDQEIADATGLTVDQVRLNLYFVPRDTAVGVLEDPVTRKFTLSYPGDKTIADLIPPPRAKEPKVRKPRKTKEAAGAPAPASSEDTADISTA